MTLEEQVGRQLVIGISGSRLTPEIVQLFRDTHAGGLIVFRPNFESAASFRKLLYDLENTLERKLLVAVDHEGGRVIHLAEGVTVFPDNLALAMTENESYAARQGEIEARELRRLGIDLNLAPTLDVLTETFSPNIGIRSYGRNPDQVARLGCARIKAMQANRLSACAKHFPGQGHSSLDAHLGLPVLATSWDEMKQIHIKPFTKAIEIGVDTVMSSHPIYPNLDPAGVPATFSKRLIGNYLRNELSFQGVILTDDLEMGALAPFGSIGDSAKRAIEAGHDLVIVSHSADAARNVFQSLHNAYRSNILSQEELEKSVGRIESLMQKRTERFTEGKPEPEIEGGFFAGKIAQEAIRVSNGMPHLLPGSVSVIFPKLSSLSGSILIEPEMLDEEKFLEAAFERAGLKAGQIQLIGLDPSYEEIETARLLAQKSKAVIFFCYDAHLFPRTRKLLDLLQSLAGHLSVVLLRDPYDQEFVRKGIPVLNAYGFRTVQIEAVMERLGVAFSGNPV